ncbi:malto-oligosyltrehalose synthase [Pontibacter liquoris]|uniref:malto-oligosyltrehalose synthase n=1 Tax=Pontibacter liquoris TaxID=2905677 RepID=UPI001FA6BFAD|nr:malto-oligosyltrehalose synthase [Pontibacter liquoris]
MTYNPSSTYRLQLSHGFTLQQVREIIPYLHALGIGTIYAAPFFVARPGSEHGYDVTAPYRINPEIGTMDEFQEIVKELKQRGMGWMQDIVPNHMAFHPDNVWLMDVLEKGPQSPFYTFFDIDFNHPDFAGQVMVPFLGEPLEQVLEKKELQLKLSEQGLTLHYFDNAYPVSIATYRTLLEKARQLSGAPEVSTLVASLLKELEKFAQETSITPAAWTNFKTKVYRAGQQQETISQALQQVVARLNEDPAQLQEVLAQQHFILCFWQETEKRINYRRFFTVNDLICLSMERPEVFDQYHQFIQQLCEEGLVQGLRVDHVDGLFDPTTYLKRLRQLAGPEAYLIVEKILEGEEHLPERWPIQGNSGYDFLAQVSNLYTSGAGRRKLTDSYRHLVPNAPLNYEQLVYDKKIFILNNYMQGELKNLLRLLQERQLIPAEPEDQWRKALAALLAAFPVYCIYGNRLPLSKQEMAVVDEAFAEARKQAPGQTEQLDGLHRLFTLEPEDSEERKHNKLYFVMRSQQFTGPLAAKGVEDTTFYNYNRLISLNEVGNSPNIFHLEPDEFHAKMQHRQLTYPHSLNATATHDTKRGEGARVRLNVLTELPEVWEQHVQQWYTIARKYTQKPTANDLYFMFQTMLGALPMEDTQADDTLVERLQEYLTKALREAKVKTDWADPNENYEEAVKELVQKLLQEDEAFWQSFYPFFRKIAHYGWLYSLCQVLLKTTCPGVPDVYQGCELWDFSLVDPDNRRPVDYAQRQAFLHEIKQQEENSTHLHAKLLHQPASGQVKLYLLYKVLHVRLQWPDLFEEGEYIPVSITGKYSRHLFAYARRYQKQWCLVVVPRLLVELISNEELPLGEKVWQDTALVLPPDAPAQWHHALDNTTLHANGSLAAASVLQTFPVALLTAQTL